MQVQYEEQDQIFLNQPHTFELEEIKEEVLNEEYKTKESEIEQLKKKIATVPFKIEDQQE